LCAEYSLFLNNCHEQRPCQMKKTYTALCFALALIGGTMVLSSNGFSKFHTNEELNHLRDYVLRTGPHGTNAFFGGSGLCGGCHGHDPAAYALITAAGEDVSIYDDWAGTMMANAAHDPFWRAKVSHEILVNPTRQVEFETRCTSCHAPLGHFDAYYHGDTTYTIADMLADSLALDGVSCGACHQQPDSAIIGKLFSGNLIYDTSRTIYGQYHAPFSGPMESFIGFKPVFGNQVKRSGLCAGCHTLITESHDLSGNPTGNMFTEQATYHEWVNSIYNNEDGINDSLGKTCQSCHIPEINENIVIAANFSFLGPRKPFGKHHLVGANSFMLDLMRNNISALGITAAPKNFDSAYVRTKRLMQDSAVIMNLSLASRTVDTAFYDLKLTNKAGHKFPSGYPSRRAFVQFVVLDDSGDTLFKNGLLNSTGVLVGQDPVYEPHHQMINNINDVQIYEMVPADVMGNVTTLLERANSVLKDNRLVPTGFSTSHYAYDTTKIVGDAEFDADFNYEASVEGSGTDVIQFHIPMNGYTGNLNVVATLYYQSIPKTFLDDMFMYTSPEISLFQGMFNTTDQTPLVVTQIKEGNLFANVANAPTILPLNIFPNPSSTGNFFINTEKPVDEITVYNLTGEMVLQTGNTNWFTINKRGTYIVRIRSGNREFVQKIIF
jgi:hypothetical protein